MQPVVTADEMRALDRATIEDIQLPALTLMETAGRAVASAAVRLLGGAPGHVAVVCGPGNNGGDGFVAARVLRDRGCDAVVYLAVDRAVIKGDARSHLEILERAGGVVRAIATPAELDELAPAISGAALAIDALFGIGTHRPIVGHLAGVVAVFNRAARRLAVDIPSGLDTDTGQIAGQVAEQPPGAVVTADLTVTMGALKIALVSAPGFIHCGEVEVADIGIPAGVLATANIRAGQSDEADLRSWIPASTALDHKGTRGHVVVIGGGPGMRGAGRLASIAALRAGAGLVTLAAEVSEQDPLVATDSVMTHALAAGGSLAALLDGKRAVVIGCGLGTGDGARAWVAEVVAAGIPAVLDADALNLYASDPARLTLAAGPLVLTPHPGEAARLLGVTTAQVLADRFAAVRRIALLTHAVVVLKGARTLVCDGTLRDDHVTVNPTGGPALATGGTGDVLAGTVGALLAQGVPPGDAARAAVFVHGRAGDQLGATLGRGAISADLPHEVARVIQALVGAPT